MSLGLATFEGIYVFVLYTDNLTLATYLPLDSLAGSSDGHFFSLGGRACGGTVDYFALASSRLILTCPRSRSSRSTARAWSSSCSTS